MYSSIGDLIIFGGTSQILEVKKPSAEGKWECCKKLISNNESTYILGKIKGYKTLSSLVCCKAYLSLHDSDMNFALTSC